jgi:enoyl-CoA hydratase/carnithine racemase
VIESATEDGVAVLTMRHGKANALDTELCQALCGALDDAVAEGAIAVVLTGAGTARRLADLGPAFGLTKRQLRQRFLARVHDLAVFDDEVDAIWKAPATLERIQSFMTSLN